MKSNGSPCLHNPVFGSLHIGKISLYTLHGLLRLFISLPKYLFAVTITSGGVGIGMHLYTIVKFFNDCLEELLSAVFRIRDGVESFVAFMQMTCVQGNVFWRQIWHFKVTVIM